MFQIWKKLLHGLYQWLCQPCRLHNYNHHQENDHYDNYHNDYYDYHYHNNNYYEGVSKMLDYL